MQYRHNAVNHTIFVQLLKEELDQEIGRVNGRFSSPDWSPIRYIYRSLPQEELASYYKAADVALVTPLRDGMNLVAKVIIITHTLCFTVTVFVVRYR